MNYLSTMMLISCISLGAQTFKLPCFGEHNDTKVFALIVIFYYNTWAQNTGITRMFLNILQKKILMVKNFGEWALLQIWQKKTLVNEQSWLKKLSFLTTEIPVHLDEMEAGHDQNVLITSRNQYES